MPVKRATDLAGTCYLPGCSALRAELDDLGAASGEPVGRRESPPPSATSRQLCADRNQEVEPDRDQLWWTVSRRPFGVPAM